MSNKLKDEIRAFSILLSLSAASFWAFIYRPGARIGLWEIHSVVMWTVGALMAPGLICVAISKVTDNE